MLNKGINNLYDSYNAMHEIVDKVFGVVLTNIRKLAQATGISSEQIYFILHKELHMKKLCTRWVQRLLTSEQKQICMQIPDDCLQCSKRNFLRRSVTMDKSWNYHYTPVTKQQSQQWIARGELLNSEKAERCIIRWNGDSVSFSRCKGNCSDWLPWEEENITGESRHFSRERSSNRGRNTL